MRSQFSNFGAPGTSRNRNNLTIRFRIRATSRSQTLCCSFINASISSWEDIVGRSIIAHGKMVESCVAGRTRSRRIMLVDADDADLRTLGAMLQQCDYQVTTCLRLKEAFSFLQDESSNYDLILSSADMPEVDPFKLVYVIRWNLNIPVILTSNHEEPDFILNGMIARGSCGYLKKPIHIDTLRGLWQCDYLATWYFRARAIEQNENWGSKCAVPAGKTPEAPGGNLDREIPVKVGKDKQKNSVIWTEELQSLFEKAVNELGVDKAKPASILKRMNVEGLAGSHVGWRWRAYLKKLKGSGDAVRQDLSEGTDCPDSTPRRRVDETSNGAGECEDRVGRKKKYMYWSPELHQQFEKAVNELGKDKASPKLILAKMKGEGLTYSQVGSHWQTYKDREKRKTLH